MSEKESNRISAEDLYRIQLITSFDGSPSGNKIIYSVQHIDRNKEKKYSNLWMLDVGKRNQTQFTFGNHSDSNPKWSPDGQSIAFISNRENEKQAQLFLLPASGGEAHPFTNLNGDFESFAWSPDSRKLIFQFRKKDLAAIEREKDPLKKELGIVNRKIDRVFYKLDGYGYLPDERWHLWVIDLDSNEVSQLTDHALFDDLQPCWSANGKSVIFISNHAQDPDLDPDAIDLFQLNIESKEIIKIPTPIGPKQLPACSPDGKWIAYVGHVGKHLDWKNNQVWLMAADGTGRAESLTQSYDFDVCGLTIGDTGSAEIPAPKWSADSQSICFQVARYGRTELKTCSIKDHRVKDLVFEDGTVGGYCLDKNEQKLFYFLSEINNPGQLWVKDLSKPQPAEKLTHLNEDWLGQIDLGQIEEVWFKGANQNDLQGWILKPPGFDPNQQYSSILEIHGGPLVQYGHCFMHEFFYLAAQGYVVYFCNPRGGQGYGEKHAGAIYQKWGTVDYDDLIAWSDYVAAKTYIDLNRMGVTGGSYGGYMTNWIIGHTKRFQAAVTQRSVSNLISMWGSSDFNWTFQEEISGCPPYESIEKLWQASPMKHIGNAVTPTLVIHSEQDLRCPIEQDEQVYVALKHMGVKTQFIIFPDEPHGLSRSGRTDRRIQRLKAISNWFDQFLKD